MRGPLRVLVLEDRPDDAELLLLALGEAGLEVQGRCVDDRAGFVAALDPEPDVILADFSLPGFSAGEALRVLADRGLTVPLIIVSGTISEETAVACLHAGAADYLVKDRLGRLPKAIAGAIERRRLRDEQAAAVERLRTAAEELAAANEALREAGREKDRLMAATAHELRTPLTSILGFSHLLLESWDNPPDDRGKRWLEIVERQARRMMGQVEDVLTLFKLESGTFEVRPAPVRVADTVRSVLEGLGMDGLVRCACPDDIELVVDRHVLEGVLAGFVSNAVKYGEDPISVEVAATTEEVTVRVCDEGPGVEPVFVDRLFDKYARSEEREWVGGLGLGLPLARELAGAASGRVWFEPNLPRGARFCVAFPLASPG